MDESPQDIEVAVISDGTVSLIGKEIRPIYLLRLQQLSMIRIDLQILHF
ncbi:hypothetical protein KKHLCK_17410 [Candidatus Electrothrix laxa]